MLERIVIWLVLAAAAIAIGTSLLVAAHSLGYRDGQKDEQIKWMQEREQLIVEQSARFARETQAREMIVADLRKENTAAQMGLRALKERLEVVTDEINKPDPSGRCGLPAGLRDSIAPIGRRSTKANPPG